MNGRVKGVVPEGSSGQGGWVGGAVKIGVGWCRLVPLPVSEVSRLFFLSVCISVSQGLSVSVSVCL